MHSLYRLYQARDQWFFFVLERASVLRLQQALDLPVLDTLSDADQQDLLAHTFGQQALDHWTDRLRVCDAAVHRLVAVQELMSDPWVVERGLSLTRDHKNIGLVRTIGPVARLSRPWWQEARQACRVQIWLRLCKRWLHAKRKKRWCTGRPRCFQDGRLWVRDPFSF